MVEYDQVIQPSGHTAYVSYNFVRDQLCEEFFDDRQDCRAQEDDVREVGDKEGNVLDRAEAVDEVARSLKRWKDFGFHILTIGVTSETNRT